MQKYDVLQEQQEQQEEEEEEEEEGEEEHHQKNTHWEDPRGGKSRTGWPANKPGPHVQHRP